jgi:hypothetical protein
MFQLIYGSSAIVAMNGKAMKNILSVARDNNRQLGITGLLLYKDGNFMQVLEGSEAAVRGLFSRLEQDQRHAGIMIYVEREIETREFANWSMGFVNLDTFIVNTPYIYARPTMVPLVNKSYATAFIRAFARPR